jgi:cytochrome c
MDRDMFDTMTITKTVGALCGALLTYLLVGWAGEIIYGAGHGGHDEVQAYVVDTGASEGGDATAEAAVPFAEIYATADATAGEGQFRQCQACHKLDGTDGTGPHLNGVVDRDIASIGGFAYSDVLLGLPGNWTPEELSHFIANPKGYAAGTKMTYPGLKDDAKRADLIAYLATLGG